MEQRNLPNATLIVVLGALSIIGCCFYYVGLILGLIALYYGFKATKLYKEDPSAWDNHSTVVIGKVLAIIGIVLNVLSILFVVWAITTFGWEVVQDKEEFQRVLQEYFQQ
ncbi:CCC motif membrane protein [Kordia zhangzhouensis]|uniref:CCC motif membrane protein n=1 Tax=Kordia zhangzhouensis TaxID=1620405 RepID=UPI000629A515|nr:CCC motif membrane protein [Kordia zhangzhouensis]